MKPVPFIVVLLSVVLLETGHLTPAWGQSTKELTALELYNRAEQKSQQGDYRGALKDYTAAIGLDPSYAFAFNNRGKARSELGDIDGALADFNRSIQIEPNNSVAYYNRSVAHKALGNLKIALASLSQAIEIDANWGDGNLANAYKMRGAIWLELGNRQRAGADLRQALSLGATGINEELTGLLKQAVGFQQWDEALLLVDVMIGTFPQQATELRAYRNRLQQMRDS